MSSPTIDEFDRFLEAQRRRCSRRLADATRRIQQARDAAKADVLTDALVVTTRGFTYGGAASADAKLTVY